MIRCDRDDTFSSNGNSALSISRESLFSWDRRRRLSSGHDHSLSSTVRQLSRVPSCRLGLVGAERRFAKAGNRVDGVRGKARATCPCPSQKRTALRRGPASVFHRPWRVRPGFFRGFERGFRDWWQVRRESRWRLWAFFLIAQASRFESGGLVTPLIAETTATPFSRSLLRPMILAARAMQRRTPTEVPPSFITCTLASCFSFAPCSVRTSLGANPTILRFAALVGTPPPHQFFSNEYNADFRGVCAVDRVGTRPILAP